MTKEDRAIEVICDALREAKIPSRAGQSALAAVLVASMKIGGFRKQQCLDLIAEGWDVSGDPPDGVKELVQ